MAVVVRCTGCRGASQVGPEAVGLLVVCPRCHEPFLAIEEATLVAKSNRRIETVYPSKPAARASRRPRPTAEPVGAPGMPDLHDAPLAPTGGLPVSVLIGFALLPFAIPLLWLIGPQLLTQPAALTIAAPAALALSASILCLSVVFTVDWSPATRIKGVLMLVGLSYFAGLSLYFLKKDMVDRAQEFFGPSQKWHEFKPPNGQYRLLLPMNPKDVHGTNVQPLAGWKLTCFQASHDPIADAPVQFLFGSGPDTKPNAENWFDEVGKAVAQDAGGDATVSPSAGVKTLDGIAGQRWLVQLNDNATRVIHVYRHHGTVYFLSIESRWLDPEDPPARRFFDSLRIGKAAKVDQ